MVRSSTCWIVESRMSSAVETGLTNHFPPSRTTSTETGPVDGVASVACISRPNGTAPPRSPARQSVVDDELDDVSLLVNVPSLDATPDASEKELPNHP